jgi:hypothetical protein
MNELPSHRMPLMHTLEERIAQQEEKLRQLKTRQQKLLVQRRTEEAKRLRTEDTRRKILLGSMLLDRMSSDEGVRNRILGELALWLSREDDRKLFALPSKPQQMHQPQA